MKNLDELRVMIDDIDTKMVELFEARMMVSKEIANYKFQHGLDILDASREQLVIDKNIKKVKNDEFIDVYRDYLIMLMKLSRQIQVKELEKKSS